MAGRTQSEIRTNASFEVLTQEIGRFRKQLKTIMSAMGQNMPVVSMVTEAEASIPFKIGQEGDGGNIFVTVAILVPGDAFKVRVQLISKRQNSILSGETEDQAITRAKAHILPFTIPISNLEREMGICIQNIGPFRYKENNPERNQYQLLRLVTVSQMENAVSFNPDEDPTDTFPFTAFKVRNDGANDSENAYFTIDDGAIATKPSRPELQYIVSNQANTETVLNDSRTRFKVFAGVDAMGNPDMNLTFDLLDIDTCNIGLRPFTDTPDSMGDTEEPMKPGGPITDRTKPFTLIDAILPLGSRWLWTRNITRNQGGKQLAIASPPIEFYAGGNPATAGIPELTPNGMNGSPAFTISSVTQQDGNHTRIEITLTQPTPIPILFKRIDIFKTLPAGTRKKVDKRDLLVEEDVFVAGATTVFVFEVKHQANKTGIMYDAEIVAINSTRAVPIKRSAAQASGNSTFNGIPSAPALALLQTGADAETSEANDSFSDHTIQASATDPTATFRSLGTDILYVVLRKVNNATDDDPDDARVKKEPFPIEDGELDATSKICRVRGLKTGRQYQWARNLAGRSGVTVRSAIGTSVSFRAGQMIVDPTNLGLSFTVTQEAKRNFLVRVTVTQTTPAVLLRNLIIFKDKRNGQGFKEIDRTVIKDRPEFQVAGMAATFDFELHARPGTTIDIKIRATAVGGQFKEVTMLNVGAVDSNEPPTMQPSPPMTGDIILNTIFGDTSNGKALVSVRVFASWMRATTGQGGTGPGGSISFNDVGADTAAALIVDGDTFLNPQQFEAGNFDPTQNSTDIVFELSLGKSYAFSRAITRRSGTPSRSSVNNIVFSAGGRVSATGLSELTSVSLTLTQVLNGAGQADNKQVEATCNFTQPATPVLLKRIEFYKRNTPAGQFKLVSGESLKDDFSYNLAGSKSYTISIPVPANTTFAIQCVLIGIGDTPSMSVRRTVGPTSMVNPPDTSTEDTARPQWGGFPAMGQSTLSTSVPRMRVKYGNPGTITVKANLPDKQVRSLITCKVAFEFICAPGGIGKVYTWNPETGVFFQGTAGFITDFGSLGQPNVLRFDPLYYIDIGKAISSAFVIDKPTITGSPPSASIIPGEAGDIPSTILADLLTAFNGGNIAYLQARVVVINNLVPTSEQQSSIGLLCQPTSINFPFRGSNRGPASEFNVYIP